MNADSLLNQLSSKDKNKLICTTIAASLINFALFWHYAHRTSRELDRKDRQITETLKTLEDAALVIEAQAPPKVELKKQSPHSNPDQFIDPKLIL
jgi:hypothetical protein